MNLRPKQTGHDESASIDQIADRMAHEIAPFFEEGQVIELRAIGVKNGNGRPHIEAGWFDSKNLLALTKCALQLTRNAKGVYYTLNPVNPDLLARRCYRVDWAQDGELTKDKDVLKRRWLLIDADPIRDAMVSATDAEKAFALETIKAVRDFLDGQKWPAPILVDSGNGYHLLYRIELPADDGGVVKGILQTLATRFNTDRAKIDTSVCNPARICKLPGTLARKGDHTQARPHREAKILEVFGR